MISHHQQRHVHVDDFVIQPLSPLQCAKVCSCELYVAGLVSGQDLFQVTLLLGGILVPVVLVITGGPV